MHTDVIDGPGAHGWDGRGMRVVVRRRALAVLAAAIATVGTSGLSIAAAATPPLPSQLDGTLLVAHGDSFSGGAMVMQTELRTATGLVPLQVPAAEHAQLLALAGQRVSVSGSRLSTAFAASSLSTAAATPAARGNAASAHAATPVGATRPLRIAVVMMHLPGSTAEPVSKASMQSAMFGATNSVANWYAQTSGGQVVVTGKVYGYLNGVSSCDLSTQTAAATAAATKYGYVASDYDSLVVYTPQQAPCAFAGMGWVGANGVFLNGTANRGVIEHELGHNLGLLHAGEYVCGVAPRTGRCLIDYGDPTDVMGGTETNHGYNAEHKYMLGWIPASEVKTVITGTQTIALTAEEHPLDAGATELIHVRAADGTLYAIDRRASVGYDAGLSGVWIRQVADVNTDDTELVRSSALAAGETFADAVHHVTIKTLTNSGATASIQVCVGPCAVPVSTQSTKPVVLAPGVASVTARNVVTRSKSAAGNAGIRLTVPTGRGVVIGHTVIVAASASGVPGPVSCRDSRGNVYSVNVNSVGVQRLIVCSAHVSSTLAAGATITIAYPAFNGSTVASANDVAGLVARYRVDRKTVLGAKGSAINSGTTPETARAAELVLGVEVHHGAANFTPGSGYTRVGAAVYFAGSGRMTITPEFKIVSTRAGYEMGGTLSSAQQWRAAVVTFFEA